MDDRIAAFGLGVGLGVGLGALMWQYRNQILEFLLRRMGWYPKETTIGSVEQLRPGDQICHQRAVFINFDHHAIVEEVINSQTVQVIHYSGSADDNYGPTTGLSESGNESSATVRRDKVDLSKFIAEGKLRRIDYVNNDNCFPADEVVKRAEGMIGQIGRWYRSYNLVDNNCEHFANWCKTGITYSNTGWRVTRFSSSYRQRRM